MNPSKINYLTPEIQSYAKSNQGLTLESGYSTLFTLGASVIVFIIVLVGFLAAVKTLSNSGSINITSDKNELIKRAGISFILLVFFISFFKMFPISLTMKSSSVASDTSAVIPASQVIIREPDAGNGTVGRAGDAQMLEMMKATEADKRAVLKAQKISINADPCTSINQKSCTSIGGMSETTLAILALLKKNCNCTMTVTGGTEWWAHSASTNHLPGNRTAVDLRKESDLTAFIYNYSTNGFKQDTTWNTCSANFTWNGFRFCDEKSINGSTSHWHIQPI